MLTTPRFLSVLLAGAALAGLTACGDDSRSEELQRQGAERAAEEVRDGTRSAADAVEQARADGEKLIDEAKQTASDAIDPVKDDTRLPDEAAEQFEQAQQQLQQPTP